MTVVTIETLKQQYRTEMEAKGYTGERMSTEEMQSLVLPGRECGECTLCCKLISVAPLDKPSGKWCSHCTPGKGCGIYADRPDICKAWSCGWRMLEWLGPEWYPLKSKMIINTVGLGMDFTNSQIEVFVDKGAYGRWREPEYLPTLRRLARKGLEEEYRFKVIVHEGDKTWVVLPNKEVEYKENTIVAPIGEDADGIVFDVITLRDRESVDRLVTLRATIQSIADDARRKTGLQDLTPLMGTIIEAALQEIERNRNNVD